VFVAVPVADAGPAPNLSKVTIIGIGPDATGNWITPANHALPGDVSGETLYICVEYIGYPNWNLVYFYQNGSRIDSSKLNNYASELITSGGVITGYVKAYSIPFASLPGSKTGYLGSFSVKADGINNGTSQDFVYSIRKK
jgi:hypothetical protein